MACCLKFFLLVSILLTFHAHLISAKQYNFKACWDRHQFEAVLEKYCSSFFVRKRSIGKEGKETRFAFFFCFFFCLFVFLFCFVFQLEVI